MSASKYNQKRIDSGELVIDDITTLVRAFQRVTGLKEDGKCGPSTTTSIRALQMKSPVDRARHACGKGIRYGLGKGGYDPSAPLPTKTGECDCSGFVSWCLGTSRHRKYGSHSWISTSDIYKDATGDQVLFEKIEKPEPGCLVVYPDSKVGKRTRQGHVALVTQTSPLMGVDCSVSSDNRYDDAIRERSVEFFLTKKHVFCKMVGSK